MAFLSLAVYAIFFRRNVAALPFAAAMLLGAFWALARGLEIASVQLAAKILWHQLRFIPVSVMPALWLLIALHHAGRSAWLTPLRMAAFLVEPAATAVLALTGGSHTLFHYAYRLNPDAVAAPLSYHNGPLFWVHTVYIYALMIMTVVILAGAFRTAQHLYRRQTRLIMVAVLLPVATDLLFQLGITPWRGLSLSPLILPVSGVFVALALFRYRLFDLMPVAAGMVVRTIADPILVLDGLDRLIDFNPAAAGVLGLNARLAIGQPVASVPAPWSELLCRQLRDKNPKAVLPVPLLGGERLFDLSLTPILDAAGRPCGRLLVLHDFSELRAAQEALRRSEEQLQQARKMEAIGRLAGGIAHDFNNLLTVMSGYCDLAAEQTPPGTPLAADIAEVRKAAERAASLTRQLLAFSRKQVMQTRAVDITALVRNLETMLRRVIGEDVELSIRLDPEAGAIRVDPGQLDQVLVNLAANARDAMPGGGRLFLETGRYRPEEAFLAANPEVKPDDYVRITVRDTGIGMDQATLDRIFEPFYTTKAQGKGTGLGLPTAYGIVKQSEGHIFCRSAPGTGTTFTILFPSVGPAAVQSEGATPALPVVARQTPTSGQTVLLVEDEPSVRSYARTVLVRNGFAVLEAADGVEALTINAPAGIDLLVTDVVMPRMRGTELAQRLSQRYPRLRTVFISGYSEQAVQDAPAGGARYLQKPFDAPQLLSAIRSALEEVASGG